jgi:hypothetical protein
MVPAGSATAQECLHGPSETPRHQIRREQALKVAVAINLQQVLLRPSPQTRRYRRLEELANIPPTPMGFALKFYTDGPTYSFSLKDTLDPCHYAIFSDQDKRIYEATPVRRAVVVPVTR